MSFNIEIIQKEVESKKFRSDPYQKKFIDFALTKFETHSLSNHQLAKSHENSLIESARLTTSSLPSSSSTIPSYDTTAVISEKEISTLTSHLKVRSDVINAQVDYLLKSMTNIENSSFFNNNATTITSATKSGTSDDVNDKNNQMNDKDNAGINEGFHKTIKLTAPCLFTSNEIVGLVNCIIDDTVPSDTSTNAPWLEALLGETSTSHRHNNAVANASCGFLVNLFKALYLPADSQLNKQPIDTDGSSVRTAVDSGSSGVAVGSVASFVDIVRVTLVYSSLSSTSSSFLF